MRLKELRKEKKLTQREVAAHFNLTFPTYCRYENGENEPGFDLLCKFADYFNVTVDYLIGRTDSNVNYANLGYDVTDYERVFLEYFRRLSNENKLIIFNMLKSAFPVAYDLPVDNVRVMLGVC